MTSNVFLGLGSNLSDPTSQLKEAVVALHTSTCVSVDAVSSFYHSKPMGPADQPDYVNAVVSITTALTPMELLSYTQHIEDAQGRVRHRRWGERTLDIDILLYDELQMSSSRLVIPHYGMCQRSFVLIPLREIAPNKTLPDGTSIASLITSDMENEVRISADNAQQWFLQCVKP